MTTMSLIWTLAGHGWADCTVADDQAEVEVTASYITAAPESLLTAVTRLLGEKESRAQFEAEPTTFRWIFYRGDTDVWVRLLQLPGSDRHDKAGTEIWSSRQTIDTVARAVIRCFDEVARRYGESGYHGKWGSPFPRAELEALRTAWHNQRRPVHVQGDGVRVIKPWRWRG
ncbi:hypothetical protein OG339_42465 [Streptosporangium sp. NBC_01495]|uniref:hypothetical protein n=1 Tax=Streptosporangium sp. NBC_01495 TaxID=2903899 RepID=UPI002E359EDA|nr:hypothetical protein [Streptosporangium sp. NBC_01495]